MENKEGRSAVVFSTKLGPGKGKKRVREWVGGWIGRALDKEQSFGIHDTASRLIDINWVWVFNLLEGVAGFVDDH
jgi:hypothetical protein